MTPVIDLQHISNTEARLLIERRYEQRENNRTARLNALSSAGERFHLLIEPVLRKETVHA